MSRKQIFVRQVALSAALGVLSSPCLANDRSNAVRNYAGVSGDSRLVAQMAMPDPAKSPANVDLDLRGSIQTSPAGSISLAELERIALENNPTLLQAESARKAALGRAKQAGMLANPVIGFQTEELAFKSLNAKPEYFGFFEQTLPLGGKLAKSRSIYQAEAMQAGIGASSQRQRILNTVRSLFYDTLGAQQQVELRTELVRIARDATNTTAELMNVGQADRPDYLESEIEVQQVEHQLQVSKNDLTQNWKLLASVIGKPDMQWAHLVGNLEDRIPSFNEDNVLSVLINDSPQMRAAQAQVQRAKAVLIRAKAEPVPDMFVRGGIGYSTEYLDTGGGSSSSGRPPRTGVEANAQVGFTLPLWNRNQGGIAAATADLEYAQSELTRLKLGLRVQFAQELKKYYNATDAVRRYKSVMLPRADEAYQLYLTKYKQMGASYPQVLISQRTMFQVRQQYINALTNLQQSAVQIEGSLLSGGLDAPGMQRGDVQRVEMSGVRSGSQGGNEEALNTAGLVEY